MKRAVWSAVAGLALAAPAPALAKGDFRLQIFPSHPRVGRVATLQLRTYSGFAPNLSPAAYPPDVTWEVFAAPPRPGAVPNVRLRREPRDPYVWSGRLRFPRAGAWRIFVNGGGPTRSIPVRVLPRGRPSVWEVLDRPLHTSSIERTSACPAAAPSGNLSDVLGWGAGLPAFGPGPAYPFLRVPDRAIIAFGAPEPANTWGGAKVIWAIAPGYHGPVLVRGRQVDGPNDVRFVDGRPGFTDWKVLHPALQLRLWGPDPVGHPALTELHAPGCYAYQVDGTSFSYTIVFEAQIAA